jgi:hypothetical protein
MIKLSHILSQVTNELYSNPICPRKPSESDEAYKQRCAPLIGPSVLMNIPSLGEDTKKEFDRAAFYEEYYTNLTPSGFKVERDGNVIMITIPPRT